MLSTDEILTGLGLVIVLAIGCRLLASWLRIPAIVLLLPVGFAAGAITDDVDPEDLFGTTFQPLVDLGVAVILFEAGLRLTWEEVPWKGIRGAAHSVVLRLVSIGVALTFAGTTVAAKLIFGLDWGVCVVLGAILVVSGPTVVMPLLDFVRPNHTVRSLLKWEGTLIDPLGALLGVAAFTAVQAGAAGGQTFHPGELLLSLVVGVAVGAAATVVLWLILRPLQRSAPQQSIIATLMCVSAALVGADLLREDSGFLAAATMGIVLANQRQINMTQILGFASTIVDLLIGLLFILISASVTPSSVTGVLPETLGLVAVMVIVLRPLNVLIAAWGSKLTVRERAFVGWIAPRGIVAAATASAFGLELSQAGVRDADKILPIAFIVIFATVVLYGLTALPVARMLGVAGKGGPTVLVVGGHPWARAISQALKEAGATVRVLTGDPGEQQAAREAGLDAVDARLGEDLDARQTALAAVSQVLIVTESNDFNALAAYELLQELGSGKVYRLAPDADLIDLVGTSEEGGILFDKDLTYAEFTRRFEAGARIEEYAGTAVPGNGATPLFVVSEDGDLTVMTAGGSAELDPADRAICLAAPPA
jgi:NhaP-type Na+/H+ or K+/H+ antiporter